MYQVYRNRTTFLVYEVHCKRSHLFPNGAPSLDIKIDNKFDGFKARDVL